MSIFALFNSDKLKPWAVKSSLWTYNAGLSCCSLEFMSATGPRYDWERFGALPSQHPNEADLLVVSGPLTDLMAEEIKKIYDQMRGPKYVISMGSCANTGGMFTPISAVIKGGVDRVLPVDIYVPGCPPRPEALMHALLRLQEKISAGNPTVVSGGANAPG